MKEQIKLHQEREASGLALIPLLFFIVIYLGVGIVLHSKGVEMAFYQFPSVVAMTIAVILAFLMYHKTGIDNNFKLFARGAGDENIMTMLMIFLLAGAFSSVAGPRNFHNSSISIYCYWHIYGYCGSDSSNCL